MADAAQRAYDKIREGILSGRFGPGSRLKEAELVQYCGVSRTPIRAALSRLAAEDYLETERNHGASVKVWDAGDMEELFELRTLLEGHAAARAAARISIAQLEIIEAAIHAMDRVLRSRAPLPRKTGEFLQHNRVVHSTIWEASGSARLVSMLGRLVEQSLQVRTVQAFSLQRLGESHHHHQELIAALRSGDGLWAEAIMRSHISAARSALALDQARKS